ncbi:nitric oxide synthase [Scenedesmus sp. PABB004]|nr:nitric oxide synthase [Scenedesmus sp. PABB004]
MRAASAACGHAVPTGAPAAAPRPPASRRRGAQGPQLAPAAASGAAATGARRPRARVAAGAAPLDDSGWGELVPGGGGGGGASQPAGGARRGSGGRRADAGGGDGGGGGGDGSGGWYGGVEGVPPAPQPRGPRPGGARGRPGDGGPASGGRSQQRERRSGGGERGDAAGGGERWSYGAGGDEERSREWQRGGTAGRPSSSPGTSPGSRWAGDARGGSSGRPSSSADRPSGSERAGGSSSGSGDRPGAGWARGAGGAAPRAAGAPPAAKRRQKGEKKAAALAPSGTPSCYGCGAALQTGVASAAGYVEAAKYEVKARHRQLKRVLCARCAGLCNGAMIPAVQDFTQKAWAAQQAALLQGHDAAQPAGAAAAGAAAGPAAAAGDAGEQLELLGKLLVTPEQLRDKISEVRGVKALVVLLVDLLDASGSFMSKVRDMVGNNPILLVGTKMDLLPPGCRPKDVAAWLADAAARRRLAVASAHLVSAHSGEGVAAVTAKIARERKGRDVFVVGAANVGKSAFVRAVLREMSSLTGGNFDAAALATRRYLPVESAMPGTTLGLIPLQAFETGGTLYDTPGVHLHHRVPHMLTPAELRLLHPRKRLLAYAPPTPLEVVRAQEEEEEDGAGGAGGYGLPAPRPRPKSVSASYVWSGLARVDVLSGPPSTQLVFYGPRTLRVYAAPLLAEGEAFELDAEDDEGEEGEEGEEEEGEQAQDGEGDGEGGDDAGAGGAGARARRGGRRLLLARESVAARGGLVPHSVVVRPPLPTAECLADVAVSGLPGWVGVYAPFTRGEVVLRVWAPRGVEVFLRPPLPCPPPPRPAGADAPEELGEVGAALDASEADAEWEAHRAGLGLGPLSAEDEDVVRLLLFGSEAAGLRGIVDGDDEDDEEEEGGEAELDGGDGDAAAAGRPAFPLVARVPERPRRGAEGAGGRPRRARAAPAGEAQPAAGGELDADALVAATIAASARVRRRSWRQQQRSNSNRAGRPPRSRGGRWEDGMAPPWQEDAGKVVIEFLKGNSGARRTIVLKHSAASVPPQLAGRVPPAAWAAFMADVEAAAAAHPYVVKPSAGRVGSWAGAAVLGAVLGVCCMNPDGGNYSDWLPQVDALIARHAPAFAAGGAALSLQRAQRSYWIEVKVNPAMAVGQPVGPPAPKPGFEPGNATAADGAVSTDLLFNWHPLLMLLAYGVLMMEAALAFRAPLSAGAPRPLRKQVHWALHSAALLAALLGFLAAWKSHTLKTPPIPNFYSPHSWLGGAALALLLGQYAVGFVSYLAPTIALERRVALGPLHRFWGLAAWGAGMAAAMVGLQEKATFLQAFAKAGVTSALIRLPALAELLLAGAVAAALFAFAGGGARRPAAAYAAVPSGTGDEEGGHHHHSGPGLVADGVADGGATAPGRPVPPSSPAVAMNLPAGGDDEGDRVPPGVRAAPPAAATASFVEPGAAEGMLWRTEAELSLPGWDALAGMFDQAFGGAAAPDGAPQPAGGFRIEISAGGDAGGAAGMRAFVSGSLGAHGLDLDWGLGDDAAALAARVAQEFASGMASVEAVMDAMLADASGGALPGLAALAGGGLAEWQARLLGGGGGGGSGARRLAQAAALEPGLELLRLLVPAEGARVA